MFEKFTGIVIFHSSGCWTCEQHIEEMNLNFSDITLVDVTKDLNYYIEEFGLDITPTTMVFQHGVEVWRKSGMLFETQLNEMRKFLN